MRKISERVVSGRYRILGVMIVLAVACAVLSLQVRVNYDMTKYLPDDSSMKKGMDIMEAEFPSMGADKSIRVMAEGLDAGREAELLEKLKTIPYVESVAHDGSAKYHKGDYSLFVVGTSCEYGSPEERSIESTLGRDFQEYRILYQNDNPGVDGVPLWLFLAAGVILVIVLLFMCRSWFEPVLFLANIGVAILINEGTNAFLGEISYVTSTMAAVLQLVLSIDYSIMLMNRYRQEKAAGLNPCEAMAAALRNCFASIAGSALTTAAGLLALAFMHFKIGLDLGFVLAKGVLFSLVCVLTLLPGLVVMGDRLIERSTKKAVHFSMRRLSRFSYRRRYILAAGFAVIFIAFFFLQGSTPIVYTLAKVDRIADIFPPENTLVMVYENGDGEAVKELAETLEQYDGVTQVISYPGLFEKAYSADELAGALDGFGSMGFDPGEGTGFDPSMLGVVYAYYYMGSSVPAEEQKLTIPELFSYVNDKLLNNPLFGKMISPEIRETVAGAKEKLDSGMRMLKSDRWSRVILYSTLPVESERTEGLITLMKEAGNGLAGAYYLIGNSAMSYEMQGSFSGELWTITLLTAAAIFLIVLISSRSAVVPAILVLIVQCGVYITVTVIGWQGYRIYFLALLIVECILMGATIDYGILYTSYYRESRKRLEPSGALEAAYDGSVHSIMTSGLIIVLITGIFGYTYPDPTIAEICRTIATGALSAMLVILFLLPGILAALDRLIVRKKPVAFLPDINEGEIQDLIQSPGQEIPVPEAVFVAGIEPVHPRVIPAPGFQDGNIAPVSAFLFHQCFPPSGGFEAQGVIPFRPGFKQRAQLALRLFPEAGNRDHDGAARPDKRQDPVREDAFTASEIMIGIHADDSGEPVLREGHVQRVPVDRDDPVLQGQVPDPLQVIRRADPEIESIDRFRGGFIGQENGGQGHTAAQVQRPVKARVKGAAAEQFIQQAE